MLELGTLISLRSYHLPRCTTHRCDARLRSPSDVCRLRSGAECRRALKLRLAEICPSGLSEAGEGGYVRWLVQRCVRVDGNSMNPDAPRPASERSSAHASSSSPAAWGGSSHHPLCYVPSFLLLLLFSLLLFAATVLCLRSFFLTTLTSLRFHLKASQPLLLFRSALCEVHLPSSLYNFISSITAPTLPQPLLPFFQSSHDNTHTFPGR